NAHNLKVPALLIGAENDNDHPLGRIKAFVGAAQVAGRDVRLWTIDGGRPEQADGTVKLAEQLRRRTHAFLTRPLRPAAQAATKRERTVTATACAPPISPAVTGGPHRQGRTRHLAKDLYL
ncbi:MAG: hypothetical protein HOV68_02305, partial [Streptomycetaceae bacterium]|nr:hypothetical protein [Streptomycetaceae bacterium]